MYAITNTYMANGTCINYAIANGLSWETVAMRVAMLSVAIFPLVLVFVATILHMKTYKSIEDIDKIN